MILICIVLSAAISFASKPTFDHAHREWARVLKKYVVVKGSRASVKYDELKKDPGYLKTYKQKIEGLSKETYNTFTLDEKLAFLINAYNALTLYLVIDHWRVKSIKDVGGILSPPWRKRFFTLFGEQRHLDYIEHDVIRKDFEDPRIHFALVCAAVSCPPLRNEPYEGSRLNHQLEDATLKFLRDRDRNRFDEKTNTLFLSSIFKWYTEDFENKFGSIQAFVAPRMAKTPEEQKKIEDPKVKLKFLDYDWSLNEVSP